MFQPISNQPIIQLGGAIYPEETGYRQCAESVMDTTTGYITFNDAGVCNYVTQFYVAAEKSIWRDEAVRTAELNQLVAKIQARSKGKEYDCILGLSGGVDSSYLAYLCKQLGLKPLCVHFDYGWNSEQAVHNIHAIIEKTGFDLHTYVIDWETFRELQKAYFKAGVIDLDVPADHLIFGSLYRVAEEKGIYTILSGSNIANEYILPLDWCYNKSDYENLNDINNQFGTKSLKKAPTLSRSRQYYYELRFQLYKECLLDLVPYSKVMAMETLKTEFGWQYYGGKHYESIFTRWYQGYYLPKVYGIDKRKAHLSNLIVNSELTREEAIHILETEPTYPLDLQEADCVYVAKKWELSLEEFYAILYSPNKRIHGDFRTFYDNSSVRKYKWSRIPIKLYSILRGK